MTRPWPTIIALWLLGVLAAAQLAKISIIAPLLQARFGLSLPQMGLLISLLEVGGAMLGFVAGLALGRIGLRRCLLTGLILLTVSGLVEAMAPDIGALFVARGLEGVAYLLVVIAAPTAIAMVAGDRERGAALALWSSFFAIGVALGGALTSLAVDRIGTGGVMGGWAALLALAGLVAARLPIGDVATHAARTRSMPRSAAWFATLAFGIYTFFGCALTLLLPTYLIRVAGASVTQAGLVTSIASMSTLPGCVLAVLLTRRGSLRPGTTVMIAACMLVLTAAVVPAVFHAARGQMTSACVFAIIALMVSGLVPPLMFARLPMLAGAMRSGDPRIAIANGLLTQFGAGGALLGPPVGALLVERWGWGSLGHALSLAVLAMLLVTVLAEVLHSRAA
jgi:MFS family permease